MPNGRYSKFDEMEVMAIICAFSSKSADYSSQALIAYNAGDMVESEYCSRRSDEYMAMRNEAARSIGDREF